MSVWAAFRQALRDFYFNSWRLAPANLVWGVLLVLALLAGPISVVGAALLVALVVPTAGLYRLGALIARDEPVAFADFLEAMRRHGATAVLIGVGAAILAAVLTTNMIVGLEAANPLGWFISALALWGLVGLAMFLTAFWPVLVDPAREGLGLRQRLALAGLAVIGRPVRMLILTAAVIALLALSTVFFALIVMVSVAFAGVLSSRVVLPLVDEVEARLPEGRRVR